MKIPSDEIPQADILSEVIKTVLAVAQGAKTFQEIATIIGKVGRQGRYYRKAAEITGLIYTPSRNTSLLTPLGQQFVQEEPTLQNPHLLRGILSSRIFQRVIPFLESRGTAGVTRSDFASFLNNSAELGAPTMAYRRISSVISWLKDLGIIKHQDNRYYISTISINNSLPNVEFTNIEDPLLPSTSELKEYSIVQQRTSAAKESIAIYLNGVAVERADNAHRALVNLTSDRIRLAGGIPKCNQLIDLATHLNNEDYIFEMKSTTSSNERSQIRAGLSQLYEYRYLQNKPNAKLILVIENPLSPDESWRHDYLEKDRGIYLVWDGSGQLYGNEKTKNDLSFLGLTSSS